MPWWKRRRRASCDTSASRDIKIRDVHLYMMEVAREHGFLFDAAQMPLNVMDAHYRSFAKLVVPELVKDGTACSG